MNLSVLNGILNVTTVSGLTVTGNGSGSLMLSGTLSNLNNALATLSYTPVNYTGPDALTISDKDTTSSLTGNAGVSITVNPSPPAFTAPTSVEAFENENSTFSGANAISVTDLSGTAESMTLAVANGILTLPTTTGLTVSGNGSGLVFVSGSLSNLNAALATLKYTPNANYIGFDTLSLSDEDTTDDLSVFTSVSITVVPPPPSISAPTSVTVSADSFAFTGQNAISIGDLAGTAEKLTLSVQEGTLALTTTTGLTVTGNGTGSVTLTGSLSNLNTALATLIYAPDVGYIGPDTFVVSDEDTVDDLTTTVDVAMTVNPAPPSVKAPASVTVAANGSIVFNGTNPITVTDQSGSAEEMILSASEGFLLLSTTTGLNVTGNNSGSVTLIGSLSNLNTDLATLKYSPHKNYYGPDTLTLADEDTTYDLVGDGSVAITVPPPSPTITAPTGVAATNGLFTFTGGYQISVADSVGTAEKMTLSVQQGTLTLTSVTGVTVAGNGSGTVIVTGPLTNLNAALLSLSYASNAGYSGFDTLSLTDEDTQLGTTGTASVSIFNENLAPTVTGPASVIVAENNPFAFTGTNVISVSDPSGSSEQMKLSVLSGSLNVTTTTGLTVSGNGTSLLTLTGSLSSLNTDLATLHFTPTTGYTGADTLSLSDEDQAAGLTGSLNVSIAVNPLAPTIAAPSSVGLNENAAFAFTGANAISVADPSGTAESLSLSILHGKLTVATTTGLTVTGNGTGTVILSGSLANLNTDLATLSDSPTAGYTGGDTLSLSDKDTADNLVGTNSVSMSISNPVPIITSPASIIATDNSAFAFTGSAAISVADMAGTAEQMTLSVLHGKLTATTTAGLTVTGNGTGSLTLSGSLASLNTALATLSYTAASYTGPDTLSLSDKDTSDGITGTAAVSITVNAPPPTITNPASVNAFENAAFAFTSPNQISVSDVSGTAELMTLAVANGILTLPTTTGLTVSGNGSGLVFLSGSLSNLNTALATLKYTPNAGYIGPDTLSLSDEDTTDDLSGFGSVSIMVVPPAPAIMLRHP